jgi:hypothetical protein
MSASVQRLGPGAASAGRAAGGPGPARPGAPAGGRPFAELLRRSSPGEARAAGGRDRRRPGGGELEAGAAAGAGPGWAPSPACARSSPGPAEGASRAAPAPGSEPDHARAGAQDPLARSGAVVSTGALAVELCGLGQGGSGSGRIELLGRRVRCSLRAPGAPGRERLARGAAGLAASLARRGLELEQLEVTP